MTPTNEGLSKIFDAIEQEYSLGNLVYEDIEGLHSIPFEEFFNQPIEGVLYDINRDEATIKTLKRNTAVNDLASCKAIRFLYDKIEKLEAKLKKYEQLDGREQSNT